MHIASKIRTAITILAIFVASDSLAAVNFVGLTEPLEKNAKALVPLAAAPCSMEQWRVQRLFRNSDKPLARALEALGYYKFDVSKTISFANPECWSADITVVLGEPTRLRNVDVTIHGDAHEDAWVMQRVRAQVPVSGKRLDHGEYESYKQLLQTALQTRGYFAAEFTKSVVTVDETLSSADIQIEVDSGPQFHFGQIEFSEQVLRPKLLAGYAEFRAGDPYDAAAISRLHESLSGSGYFGSVSVQADPADDGSHEVPVVVTLTPGLRRVYTTGLGFATDIGVQGRLGYTNRRLNDRGRQFDSKLFLSSVDSQLTAAYRWPRGNPREEWVDIFAGLQRKKTDTSESDKVTLGIRVARNRSKNWLETPYANLTAEDFQVGEDAASSRLLIVGINWQSTIGREISRVRSGHRISLDVRGSYEGAISDTTFAQLTGSTKWAFPIGESSRLLTRADLGTTYSPDFVDLPPTVTFFAGGDNSVRGYDYETLGPLDADGNVVGGRHVASFSVEFDRLIAEKWSVAAFVDVGDAFDDFGGINLRAGVGVGLRWYSPLGPIRVDFAHPMDDPDRNFRLHISLGPDL